MIYVNTVSLKAKQRCVMGVGMCLYANSNRVVNMWNSLSSYVVSAESVNCFKSRLDKLWKDHEIIYNFRAEIYGTGNHSAVTV